VTFALERGWEGVALTPLHSLRFGVGQFKVAKRRSFRGTWEPTPPEPTGLKVGAGSADSQGKAPKRRIGGGVGFQTP